jgi:hypothetical protein
VVKSYPAAGQAMSAGVLVMTVTFDQPMKPGAFDFGPAPGGEQPHCLKIPRLLDDTKTFALLCTTDPGKTYALTLNARAQGGFENVAEHRADPLTLSFKTTDGEGPQDIHEAMKAAGLRDSLDMPILESPDRRNEKAPTVATPVVSSGLAGEFRARMFNGKPETLGGANFLNSLVVPDGFSGRTGP